MISKYSHKGLSWIDLESGSEEELAHAIEQLYVPSYIQEKIKRGLQQNVIHMDDDFIVANISDKLTFVVCDKYVLSIHDEPIHAIDKFGKEMELDIIVEDKSQIKNNKLLFAHLLKNLYLGGEKQMVTSKLEIESLKRDLLKNSKKLKLFTILSIIFLVTTIIFICL